VWNVKEENGVEVFGDYEVLGTTILGDDVPPAVKGANIKLLNAIGAEELRKMTIKVASADGKKPKKSDKGENRMNITDVRAAFPDLKVLCVKGENIFALNSKNAVVMTSAEKDGENVICGKVVELSLNASAVVGEETVEIPVDSIIEAATAELADLRKQNKEATEQKDAALKALSEMQKAEKERRLSELKEKVNARAADLEKCFGVCVESELLAKLTSEENLAKYCEMVDAEGKYCGLSAAIKDLDNEYTEARLHSARIKANSKVTWGTLRDDAAAEKTDDFEKVMEEIN
ncbi:MAG: hypothetical protein J6S14_13670, partial [Clostridia bacterium]|nr:hypothetical protein [Clostridia bacterium]